MKIDVLLMSFFLAAVGLVHAAAGQEQAMGVPTEYGAFGQLDAKLILKIAKNLAIADRSHWAQTSSKFCILLQPGVNKGFESYYKRCESYWLNPIKFVDLPNPLDGKCCSALAFAHDNKTLVVVAGSGCSSQIRLLDIETGEIKQTIDCEYVDSLAIAPDGKSLALGSASCHTVKIWDLEKNNLKKQLFDDRYLCVHSVEFSSDGKLLAVGTSDNHVKIFDVEQGTEKMNLTEHEGFDQYSNSLAFSLEGNLLAAGTDRNWINLWEVETGNYKTGIYAR